MNRSPRLDSIAVGASARGKIKAKLIRFTLVFMVFVMLAGVGGGFVIRSAMAQDEGPSVMGKSESKTTTSGNWIVVSIAFVVGIGTVGASYAVGKIGSAALGAVSENPDLFGRSLIYVGLAEGLAIYGLIIGIMLLGKL